MTLVRKDEEDWDTTRRSVGHDRPSQMGKWKEMSVGSRLYLKGKESLRLKRKIHTDTE